MRKQENLGLPMFWLQSEVAPYKVQGRGHPALKHNAYRFLLNSGSTTTNPEENKNSVAASGIGLSENAFKMK